MNHTWWYTCIRVRPYTKNLPRIITQIFPAIVNGMHFSFINEWMQCRWSNLQEKHNVAQFLFGKSISMSINGTVKKKLFALNIVYSQVIGRLTKCYSISTLIWRRIVNLVRFTSSNDVMNVHFDKLITKVGITFKIQSHNFKICIRRKPQESFRRDKRLIQLSQYRKWKFKCKFMKVSGCVWNSSTRDSVKGTDPLVTCIVFKLVWHYSPDYLQLLVLTK